MTNLDEPRRFDVVVCGSLHLDVVVNAPRLPGLDETAVGSAWHFACGGKGRNQAAQAASAGARTAMIGRVGDDDFGRTLLDSLDRAAVDRSEVAVDAAAGSGMSVAIVNAAGGYGAVIVSGANLAIDPAHLDAACERLGPAPVLVLQNEITEAANLAAATVAKARGALVILNAAPARAMVPALLACIDILVVNRVEAEQLSGLPVTDVMAAIAAGRALGGRVIVTLGGDGLVAIEPDAAPLFIAAETVDVVSTHGAGDCFVGALASRLAQGDALHHAARFASVAAARHVSRKP